MHFKRLRIALLQDPLKLAMAPNVFNWIEYHHEEFLGVIVGIVVALWHWCLSGVSLVSPSVSKGVPDWQFSSRTPIFKMYGLAQII